MSTVNIPSYHEDPNYRYKMPKVRAKIEGRGNGIKTNITNMGDIARALKRPPEYATKFCGCELGSQSKFDAAEGKAIVNGAHTEMDLQVIIDKFIDRFVLCPKCRLPEIDLSVYKKRIRGKCNACGYQGDMDNTHKVCSSILKNPPDGQESTIGSKKKKSREERQRERAEKAARGGSGSGEKDSDEDENDEDDLSTENKKKNKKRLNDKNSSENEKKIEENDEKKHRHKSKKDDKAKDDKHHKHKEERHKDKEERHKDKEERHKDKEERHKDKEERHKDKEERHKDKEERHKDKEERHKDKEERHKDKEERHREKEERHKDKEERHKDKDERSKEERHKDREDRHKEDKKDKKKSKDDKKNKRTDRHSTTDELSGHKDKDPDEEDNFSTDSEGEVDDEGVQHASSLGYDSPEVERVIQRLQAFLAQTLYKPETQAFFQEVRILQVAQAFGGQIRAYVAFASLFGDEFSLTALKSRIHLLAAVCDRSVSPSEVLEALEEFVARRSPASFANYAILCNELYDSDVIDEEAFLARYVKGTKGVGGETFETAKKSAAPFIKWLEEAESASSSEDESSA